MVAQSPLEILYHYYSRWSRISAFATIIHFQWYCIMWVTQLQHFVTKNKFLNSKKWFKIHFHPITY